VTQVSWDTDPGLLSARDWHHVVAIVDATAGVLSFVVDGVLCDGGDARPYGWTHLASALRDVRGAPTLRLAPGGSQLAKLRVYNRHLRTSEAVANYHAGR
jgi:hypothetical protein